MARNLAVFFLMTGCAPFVEAAFAPAVVIRAHPIIWESVRTNGIVETNETITCAISLQNLGDLYAANVSAEFLSLNGITPVSPGQDYGTMLISNEPVTREFTFTVAGPAPRVAQAVLSIRSDGVEIGQNVFDVPVGETVASFSNLDPLLVPANRTNGIGPASAYPSTIPVSGLRGTLTGLRVTLHNYSHNFPEDVNAVLVGPMGTNVMLMSDCGGFTGTTNVNLTFDSRLTNSLPTQGGLNSGTYSCTDYNHPNTMEAPSPTPGPGTFLGMFRRLDPNGEWKLFLDDRRLEDSGFLRGGWSLTFFLQPPPELAIRNNGDGRVRITLDNSGNRSFLIDHSSNAQDWQLLGQVPASTNSVSIFDPIGTGNRFYRARRNSP